MDEVVHVLSLERWVALCKVRPEVRGLHDLDEPAVEDGPREVSEVVQAGPEGPEEVGGAGLREGQQEEAEKQKENEVKPEREDKEKETEEETPKEREQSEEESSGSERFRQSPPRRRPHSPSPSLQPPRAVLRPGPGGKGKPAVGGEGGGGKGQRGSFQLGGFWFGHDFQVPIEGPEVCGRYIRAKKSAKTAR